MRRCDLGHERGITLVEIIVVIVLMGILSGIIAIPVMTAAKAWSDMVLQKDAVEQARIGLDRLIRELRSIQWVNGRPSVTTMGTNQIRFVTAAGDDLTYCWNDAVNCDPDPTHVTRLVRKDNIALKNDPAALSVRNFSLLYYEDSNALIGQMRQEAETAAPAPDVVTCNPAPCTVVGSDVILSADGETISYQFKGSGIAWMGPKDVDLGMGDVWVDPPSGCLDTPPFPCPPTATIDQYASTPLTTPQPLFTWHAVSPTYMSHTIAIGFSGSKNSSSTGTAVSIDAFDRLISRVVVTLTAANGTFDKDPCTQPAGSYSIPFSCLRDQASFRSAN